MPSGSITETLINEVRARPCLYDMTHPDYKRTDIKVNNWKAISECLDELTINRECKIIYKIMSDFLHPFSRRVMY